MARLLKKNSITEQREAEITIKILLKNKKSHLQFTQISKLHEQKCFLSKKKNRLVEYEEAHFIN